ncbi:hippocampus abundant transcript 1 -like protein [Labeo rohita]|uniref:Hippocampus abundant transcript 1-like protein n=2 Tax=Labeo rohita TaxID=84645 RepID=A0A498N734_LABRO|nr:hippocampus abundant transcript 1 protein [Labeo rohita]KAI2661942.1 Hippocampus abundant transcript 1 protein [Labeo rohita]RXN28631.1 hippocampus abundant transcript 1 -like protein [Labeo rohita]
MKNIMLIKHIRQRSVGRAKVAHAVVVIFMEFFAWGLLTTPMLTVLHETFPQHTFLMNGLIQGVKGFLSFMSAPLIGALSDVWGRKSFLLLTVFFTCAPIPLMRLSPWWFFALMSVSGLFSVTFSVIFAYVADITEENERSTAYGLVSATFAASLVTSPAIGAFLSFQYGDSLVVLLATIIAVADILFILLVVPESLPDKMRLSSWGLPISWEQADPFASLRKVGKDSTVLLICVTVFLSYLPEAGQYSSFFLYLGQVINFSSGAIAGFIAMVGILSIVAQTLLLSVLMKKIGNKNTVLLGLGFQLFQLAWYGFGSEPWMMWAAGAVAAVSSITFPAVSALVSRCTDRDQQGAVQGMITGIRGLCNGLGPAMFGFIFFLFNVELKEMSPMQPNPVSPDTEEKRVIPGPPFLFGACTVILALLVAVFIPVQHVPAVKTCSTRVMTEPASGVTENGSVPVSDEDNEPLLQDSSL